jgi:hypothetical protein
MFESHWLDIARAKGRQRRDASMRGGGKRGEQISKTANREEVYFPLPSIPSNVWEEIVQIRKHERDRAS